MPADIQHLGSPTPVLGGLRTQPLDQGFEGLVAVGEFDVVVRLGRGPGTRSGGARDGRVWRVFKAFWMASLNCLAVAGSVCLISSSRKLPSWKLTSDRMPLSGRIRLVIAAAFLVEQVQQRAERFVRALVEELPEFGLLRGQPFADDRW